MYLETKLWSKNHFLRLGFAVHLLRDLHSLSDFPFRPGREWRYQVNEPHGSTLCGSAAPILGYPFKYSGIILKTTNAQTLFPVKSEFLHVGSKHWYLKKKKYVQVIQVDNEDWEPLCRGGAGARRRETLTHFLTELCTNMGFLNV